MQNNGLRFTNVLIMILRMFMNTTSQMKPKWSSLGPWAGAIKHYGFVMNRLHFNLSCLFKLVCLSQPKNATLLWNPVNLPKISSTQSLGLFEKSKKNKGYVYKQTSLRKRPTMLCILYWIKK